MNLFGLGIVLIVVGIVLWAAAIAAHLGWVLLIVGIVLLILSVLTNMGGGMRWPRR